MKRYKEHKGVFLNIMGCKKYRESGAKRTTFNNLSYTKTSLESKVPFLPESSGLTSP